MTAAPAEPLVECALDYARRGWPVLPLHTWRGERGCSCGNATCSSPAKHPRLKDGLHGASTDPETVAGWWRRWPDANVGLRTGVVFDVLDVDGEQGAQSIVDLCRQRNVEMPSGPWSNTGGGGDHFLFLPTGAGNRAGILDKVDWRGRNGYIVAPPSLHASGNFYAWQEGPETPLSAAPAWLVELVSPPRTERPPTPPRALPVDVGDGTPYGLRALEAELAELARAPQGMRNHSLNATAYNLYQLVAGGELREHVVTERLHSVGAGIGLPDTEVRQTVDSAFKAGMKEPRSAPELVVIHGSKATTNGSGKAPAEAKKDEPRLFRLHTAAQLAEAADKPMEWLVRGMLAQPTAGMVAGEAKTLKTYLSLFTLVGVASGTSIFGHFEVDEPKPVVVYVGEGGSMPYGRRLIRICRAMDVEITDLPLHATFDVAPIGSAMFNESLARDLRELSPGLVVIDPLYAYHPPANKGSSLYEEGAMLADVGSRCMDSGANLLIVNHFNQTGTGKNLNRITMSGGAEWVDSWMLASHRIEPDVDEGTFSLALEIGSRQWGGRSWELDLDVGRFNFDTNDHDGEITWGLRKASSGGDSEAEKIMRVVGTQPWTMTPRELAEAVGGHATKTRQMIADLIASGVIEMGEAARIDAKGRSRRIEVCGPRVDRRSAVGPDGPRTEEI